MHPKHSPSANPLREKVTKDPVKTTRLPSAVNTIVLLQERDTWRSKKSTNNTEICNFSPLMTFLLVCLSKWKHPASITPIIGAALFAKDNTSNHNKPKNTALMTSTLPISKNCIPLKPEFLSISTLSIPTAPPLPDTQSSRTISKIRKSAKRSVFSRTKTETKWMLRLWEQKGSALRATSKDFWILRHSFASLPEGWTRRRRKAMENSMKNCRLCRPK